MSDLAQLEAKVREAEAVCNTVLDALNASYGTEAEWECQLAWEAAEDRYYRANEEYRRACAGHAVAGG